MAPPVAGGNGGLAKAVVVVVLVLCMARWSAGVGVNWGTQLSHPLPASTVVQLLKDNGFDRVKLFDAEDGILGALKGSGIQMMVGIPNNMLADLASSAKAAENWVAANVSKHVSDGVDIRLVTVGNEPFLETFNGTYLNTTFPAMQSIQAALVKAGLSSQVKVTVALNADVYQSASGKPSDGDFRADIHGLMLTIVQFLASNGAPFVANVYPFISLYEDPNFPLAYAFFQSSSSPVVDDGGGFTYQNTFNANHDTLVAALRRNGFPDVPVVVGEVGWPTDGDANANANPEYARRFSQGLLDHVASGRAAPSTLTSSASSTRTRRASGRATSSATGASSTTTARPSARSACVAPAAARSRRRGASLTSTGGGACSSLRPTSPTRRSATASATPAASPTAPASGTRPPAAASTPRATSRTRTTATTRSTTRTTAPATSADSPPPPPSTPTCRFIVEISPSSAVASNVAGGVAAVLVALLLCRVF